MIIKNFLPKCFDLFKDIVSPPQCSSCRKFLNHRAVFCLECEKFLKPVVSSVLDITPSKKFTVFAVSDYSGPIRRLIVSKRYSNHASCVQLAQLMWNNTFLNEQQFDCLVPSMSAKLVKFGIMRWLQ